MKKYISRRFSRIKYTIDAEVISANQRVQSVQICGKERTDIVIHNRYAAKRHGLLRLTPLVNTFCQAEIVSLSLSKGDLQKSLEQILIANQIRYEK